MAIKMYFSFSCKNIIKTKKFVLTGEDYTAYSLFPLMWSHLSNILYNNKNNNIEK